MTRPCSTCCPNHRFRSIHSAAQYLLAAFRRSGGALALIRSPQFAEVNALQAELSVGDQGSGPYNRSFFNTQGLPSVADLQVSTLHNIRESNDTLQQRLMADVQVVETTNAQINQINDLALPVVKSATGQDLGVDPEAWKTWWTNQQGYAYQSSRPKNKPTYTDIFTVKHRITPAIRVSLPGRSSRLSTALA